MKPPYFRQAIHNMTKRGPDKHDRVHILNTLLTHGPVVYYFGLAQEEYECLCPDSRWEHRAAQAMLFQRAEGRLPESTLVPRLFRWAGEAGHRITRLDALVCSHGEEPLMTLSRAWRVHYRLNERDPIALIQTNLNPRAFGTRYKLHPKPTPLQVVTLESALTCSLLCPESPTAQ